MLSIQREYVVKPILLAALLAMLPALGNAAPRSPPPGTIKVAFALSRHVNVMDVAGPWEVFADTSLKDAQGKDVSPYELYTVSAGKAPLHSEGANHPGLTITPDYDFSDAPTPDIVVVPAQQGGPALQAWLKKIHARHITIISVCTGAFQLGKAGLLNGKQATTHHWFFGDFAQEFPDVALVKQVRYVQADPITFTAGGLTSGVDLALHMVADRFGPDTAQRTADFMEYLGTGWKTNKGISTLTTPVTRETWSGQLGRGSDLLLHVVITGASHAMTVDIPAEHVVGAVATLNETHDRTTSVTIHIPGHPAVFTGVMNAADNAFSGSFAQDGKTYSLILAKQAAGR